MAKPFFKTVALQFKFHRLTSVPPVAKRFKRRATRHNVTLPAGEIIIEPTEGVLPTEVLKDLESAGYRLTNMTCEERGEDNKHYMVFYIFTHRSTSEKPSEAFRRVQGLMRRELQIVSEDALWKTRAYSNPLADGKRGANVVFDTRKPFMQGNGEPVTVWRTDKAGERIGDAPILLQADHLLRFMDQAPVLVAA